MLPNLPEIPLNTNKNIISSKTENNLPRLPDYESDINNIKIVEVKEDLYGEQFSEMQKSSYSKPSKEAISSPPQKQASAKEFADRNYIKKDNEIFVKIKKFEGAISSFDEINEKIREMQEDLDRAKKLIKDETKELEEWENELTKMKKSLDAIDRNLFSEIEK